MDNPEKLATYARRSKTNKTQHNMCWTPLCTNKHNTICVGHHYAQTDTNNVNRT